MTIQNNELTKLPNIGQVLAEKLNDIGIKSAADLERLGAENVFIKLKTIDSGACLNMLYAIDGAIKGIRWHKIDKTRLQELADFFKMTELQK